MEINAIGLACPKPVILTKKGLKEFPNEVARVLVDNEIAAQNLQKLAKALNYGFKSTKLGENEYLAELFPEGQSTENKANQEFSDGDNHLFGIIDNFSSKIQEIRQENVSQELNLSGEFVIIFSSDEMGKGDSEFSKTLLEGFIYSLSEQDQLPRYILCYNRGVFLSAQNPNTVKDLKSLQENGVEILSCGLCLDQYGLKQNLQVGSITNMYRICEIMSRYRNVSPC